MLITTSQLHSAKLEVTLHVGSNPIGWFRKFGLVISPAIAPDGNNPSGNYMLKGNNRNTRTRCGICSKFTINTLELRRAFFVNFEHISHLVLVFPLLT